MAGVRQNSSPYIGDLSSIELLHCFVPGGLLITKADEDFTIIEANEGYYTLTGYTKKEIYSKYKNKGVLTVHPDSIDEAIRSFYEQVKSNADNSFTFKSRLINKKRGYKWVHFSGRLVKRPNCESVVCFLLADVSEEFSTLAKLEKEQSFNALIASLSEDAFFDCSIQDNTMRYSRNFMQRFGLEETVIDYPKSLIKRGIVAPDTISAFKNRFKKGYSGIVEEELHFLLPDGSDVWYLCHYNTIKDSKGVPIRAVGKLTDITKQRVKIDELSEYAQRDQLTGLYNKVTTEQLIKDTLHLRRVYDEKYALLIIDIDNFKNVNDTLGHLYGDTVLAQLADSLKPLFRSEDILGRIGGDEFFVFLKNYKSEKILFEKARQICGIFIQSCNGNGFTVDISASIGISLCPEHGTQFEHLYKHADTALYTAKERGKNTFALYDGRDFTGGKARRTDIDHADQLQKNFTDYHLGYLFTALFNSTDPISTIHAVLKLITEHYNFSRGYIFEFTEDEKYFSNTFEWCVKDIQGIINRMQNLPADAFPPIDVTLRETGKLIVPKISDLPPFERSMAEPKGVKSLIVFALYNNKKLVAFIGFDDCAKERNFTAEEIEEISTTSNVLGTFVLKHRLNELIQRNDSILTAIINNFEQAVYVIDRNTYKVLYENTAAIVFTRKSIIGELCYEAYMGVSAPCAKCPMKTLSAENPKGSAQLTNKQFDCDITTVAAIIDYHGKKRVCLNMCTENKI